MFGILLVFLFDEPLSNLDAKLRVQMRVEIRKLQRELGTTSLYVTHDQVEAMTMADRLVVMHDGIAEQIGTPLDVYQSPATRFVAGFIGSPAMNFIDGEMETGAVLLPDGTRVPLTNRSLSKGKVTVGVRPEHLTPDPDGELCLTVDLAESLGAEVMVHGRINGYTETLTIRQSGNTVPAMGESYRCRIDPALVHLFDYENGVRISG